MLILPSLKSDPGFPLAGLVWQLTTLWETRNSSALLSALILDELDSILFMRLFKKIGSPHFCLFVSVLQSFDFFSFHWLTGVCECATCLLTRQEMMMPVALSRVQAVWLMLLSSQAGHCEVPVCYDFPSLDSTAIHHWFEVFFHVCVTVCVSLYCVYVCVCVISRNVLN